MQSLKIISDIYKRINHISKLKQNKYQIYIALKIFIYFIFLVIMGIIDNYIPNNFCVIVNFLSALLVLFAIEHQFKTNNKWCFIIALSLGIVITVCEGEFSYSAVYDWISYIFAFVLYANYKNNKHIFYLFAGLFIVYIATANNVRQQLHDYQSYGLANPYQMVQLQNNSISVLDTNYANTLLHLNNDSIYLIDFWNITCPTCDIQMASDLPLIKNQFKQVNYYSICYSIKDTAKEIKKIKSKTKYGSHYLLYNNYEKTRFDIQGFPRYYIFKGNQQLFVGDLIRAKSKLSELFEQ
jgi:thiol-disulfide isomerase/thioredoxin